MLNNFPGPRCYFKENADLYDSKPILLSAILICPKEHNLEIMFIPWNEPNSKS